MNFILPEKRSIEPEILKKMKIILIVKKGCFFSGREKRFKKLKKFLWKTAL